MSGPTERRQSARILTEFPLSLFDDGGALLDDHALAHDVSDKGFRAECNADLAKGRFVRFKIQLGETDSVSGRGKVAWVERTDMALWAGVEFLSLPWSEKRRLRRFTSPPAVAWPLVLDRAITAGVWATITLLLWNALASRFWRHMLWVLAPKALAAVVLGWALREVLRSRR